MSNEAQYKIEPKLRFPEFRDSGEWKIKSVGEICQILNNLRKPITSSNRVKGKYPYYGASGIVDYVDDFIFEERLLLVGEDGAKWGPFENTAFIAEGKYWVNNHAHVLKSTGINDTLLENYLVMLDINKFVTGAAPPKLTLGKLKEIPVPVPLSGIEQQKIADCLSSLDDFINAQNQKLETLKAHKKGLMQQLFPGEGEMVPKLRFREFRDKGEWVEKALGELIEIKGRIGYRGYTVEDIVNKGEGAISLSPSNINAAGSLSFEKSTYISWAKYEESPEIMLDAGFTVLVKTGSTFGKAALINKLPEKSTINPQFVVLKPIKINSVFLFLIVTNSSIQGQINETVVGGAIPTLSQDSISKFEILIPPDEEKKEQQKIADCLSSLDELITAQTEKLDVLQKHKKGLMQQLFPNINDVS